MMTPIEDAARRIQSDNQAARQRGRDAFRMLSDQLTSLEGTIDVDAILARITGDAEAVGAGEEVPPQAGATPAMDGNLGQSATDR